MAFQFPFLATLDGLPRPGRPDRVAVAIERLLDRAEAAGAECVAAIREMLEHPQGSPLIAAIFGNSPFLTEAILAEPAFFVALLTQGPDATFAELLTPINDELAAVAQSPDLMRRLRHAKRRAALTIAVADLCGTWPLLRVTGALSEFADRCLSVAAGHALAVKRVQKGEVLTPALVADSRRGLIILGMGKLGARELNYSSDVDLILLYDPDRVSPGVVALRDTLRETYVRFAQDLVKLIQERTGDGYVFRVDLRLRPDPASTPAALSVLAAETYYETVGQNWERAAMIKARLVAGDVDAAALFQRNLRPFIWRRHLDFAAINDIHSIKRQINAHKGGTEAILGHDLKLGRGGIREIEFFVQTQQLIWGGRDPSLRLRPTLEVLEALVRAGRVQRPIADALADAYEKLRTWEHRVQMVEDQQTHKLPTDPEAFAALAAFSGFASAQAFAVAVAETLGQVRSHYGDLFEESPPLSGPGNLVFTGADDDPETITTLQGMGFADASSLSETVRGWHHGRIRATRSARARELLTELMPTLLQALAQMPDPMATFGRFDRFLTNLPAGVQILSLFHQNPGVLDLVAEIMGSAPGLAEHLARHSRLLDGLIHDARRISADLPVMIEADLAEDLARDLAQTQGFEDVLDSVRRWTGDRRFQIGVALLRGEITPEAAARALSAVADSVIAALLPQVHREFAQTHGQVPGGEFCVLGLGKLGARELTPTSDLDLVFIYRMPETVEQSDGGKPLPPSLYFQRLGQRLIAALTVLTAAGELYQVDMRLRPSGNKGPVACSLDSFTTYQTDDAWTWEHMALIRARTVAGDARLCAAVQAVRMETLTRPRDKGLILADVADMRARIAKERPGSGPFDVKDRPGGLVDIEFIAQGLILSTVAPGAKALPDDLGNTLTALQWLIDQGAVTPEAGEVLLHACRLWQRLQVLLRLAGTGKFDPATAPEGMRRALVHAAGVLDFSALEQEMSEAATRVRRLFTDLIDAPAQRPAPPEGDARP
ncbi:bifunctional [glutamine synthetase] adenylyltransferase/[glutamine synthetase]-adenylyl-L-tyrosine phosphorylase [Elstera sp.]|jgi:glutamate-ammonia-ligase adenylyltransferase|uniref:bifunctional [glutamine synthetase] adenylyltransferase/[glutamine synthetase]-adenylyl-L-tyrosine phosphorylase n=1 Tax=Elstera sp. TaxID=1916664 RepID=UPI0037C15D1F